MPAERPSGFTLVEMLIAMGIGLVILLGAAAMLGGAGDNYTRIGGGVETGREARAALNQLAEDLATAHFHPDCVFQAGEKDWRLDRIGFLSLQPADAQSLDGHTGDLCAIHYYPKDLRIGGHTVRCLMRGMRESRETFSALRKGEIAQLFTPRDADEPIAIGIISFTARPKLRDADGSWKNRGPSGSQPPEAVEVRLITARRQLSAHLHNSADWDGSGKSSFGPPEAAADNRELEIHSTLIRHGHDASR